MKSGRDEVLMALHMCLGFLSDPPLGGSKAWQEGVKESFKDKRLYFVCCHSGSGFGHIQKCFPRGGSRTGQTLVDEGLLL